jgi:ubiquinone/menaquinone biosynthesis C-methylase UbiE
MEGALASALLDAVLHGRPYTSDEWDAYLEEFHSRFPAANGLFLVVETLNGETSYQALARTVLADAPASVLDVGCGDGSLFDSLTDSISRNGRLVGLDFAEAELDVGRRRFSEDPRVEFVHANARTLPFPDDSFDTVVSHQFLNFVPDAGAFVREMVRVLRPGGSLCAAINRGWFTPEERESNWVYLNETANAALRAAYPTFRYPRMNDPRVYSDAGLSDLFEEVSSLRKSTLKIEIVVPGARMTPQRAAEIYNRMYIYGTVPERPEILKAVEERARELAAPDRELLVEIPFRILRIRKAE